MVLSPPGVFLRGACVNFDNLVGSKPVLLVDLVALFSRRFVMDQRPCSLSAVKFLIGVSSCSCLVRCFSLRRGIAIKARALGVAWCMCRSRLGETPPCWWRGKRVTNPKLGRRLFVALLGHLWNSLRLSTIESRGFYGDFPPSSTSF